MGTELFIVVGVFNVHDATSPCNKSQGLVASCELAILVGIRGTSRRD